jgi:hypothetical protein
MKLGRYYEIESDDEDVHLAMMLDGVQVGGAMFPVEFCQGARCLAEQMGEAFINNSESWQTIH